MKKPIAAFAAVLLSGGVVLGTSTTAALADDDVPVDQPTAQVTSTDAPAPDTTQPATDTSTSKDVGLPPAAVDKMIQPAQQPVVATPVTKTLAWVLPNGGTSTNVTWPQAGPVDPATYVPSTCGVTETLQVDIYRYATEEQKSVVDHLGDDKVLNQGEDSNVYISNTWKTVTGAQCPPKPTVQECTAFGPIVSQATTPANALPAPWSTTETRATGHNVIEGTDLHVYTEGNTSTDKAAAYYPVDLPFGASGKPTINYTAKSGGTEPGFQQVIDLGGKNGILVYEPVYGGALWLTNSSDASFKAGAPHTGGGYGSPYYGTADEWLQAFPQLHLNHIGYSLGSGVKGDYKINSIGLGGKCMISFKEFQKPQPPVVTPTETSSSTTDCTSGKVTGETVVTTPVYTYNETTGVYVRGTDKVVTTPFTRDATVVECPAPKQDIPPGAHITNASNTTPDHLALTGTMAQDTLYWLLGAALFGGLLGGAAIWQSRRQRSVSVKSDK